MRGREGEGRVGGGFNFIIQPLRFGGDKTATWQRATEADSLGRGVQGIFGELSFKTSESVCFNNLPNRCDFTTRTDAFCMCATLDAF